MRFIIQAGSPIYTGNYEEEDYSLMTAIETVFPMYTEDAILNWNNIYIFR